MRAAKAAADAIAADNARILKLYDNLEATAAKLTASAATYTADWAQFSAALDAANDARQQCPRIPRERGAETAEQMVIREMTRLAYHADATMAPAGSGHLLAAGDPRQLQPLTDAVRQHVEVIRSDLGGEATND